MTDEPRHCDEYIDDPEAPEVLRAFLARARAPAHGHLSDDPYPKLFATYVGQSWHGIEPGDRVHVVMASRLGDVGITRDFGPNANYEARCFLDRLSNFGDAP